MSPGPHPGGLLAALAGLVVAITVIVASAALLAAGPVRTDAPATAQPTTAAAWQAPSARPFAPADDRR